MALFYPWWLHDLWGLWVVKTLPYIGVQYYSQNILLALMFKNIILSLIWNNFSKLVWKSILEINVLSLAYSWKCIIFNLKTSSKTLWKSMFPYLNVRTFYLLEYSFTIYSIEETELNFYSYSTQWCILKK